MQHARNTTVGIHPGACLATVMDAVAELERLRVRAVELERAHSAVVENAAARVAQLELDVFAAEVRAEEAEAQALDAARSLNEVRAALAALGHTRLQAAGRR